MIDDPDAPALLQAGRTFPAPLRSPRITVPELVSTWGRGWAVSRGLPEPVEIPGGFRADVGVPGHRVRYVLHTWDAHLLETLAQRATEPGSWIKVSGSATDLRSALPARWTMDDPAYLMSAPVAAGTDDSPAPYETLVTTEGEVVVARVVDTAGATAASGRLAPAGDCAVIDQVETAPAHRRRGLGTAVVRALCDHAARAGPRTGILVATAAGRRLYHALGWTVRSEIAAAYVREHRPGRRRAMACHPRTPDTDPAG